MVSILASLPAARPGDLSARDPFLVTKLHLPPPPPDLVPRPHLTERLEPAPGARLTLVCAPTGFGKTTALRDWAERTEWPVAWLSLDRGDNDPACLWNYVIAAIQTWRPEAGEHALALLRLPELPPAEYVVTSLINDLAADPQPLALVLDDYHLIEDEAVHASLRFLLEHLPPHVHVLIAGRSDPPLGLPRLRARAALVELRGDDLRFQPHETAALLVGALGLPLAEEDVRLLDERTEGWAAGLRLAALALRGQPDVHAVVAGFGGSHRSIGDYLADEVLDRQPPDVLRFLLETSVLERLCGPLCDAVTGGAPGQGQTMLEGLEHCNAFLQPLDGERRWYRYQGLFGDALRDRLRRAMPGQEEALHRRAAGWLFENGLTGAAVRHALAGDAPEIVADIVENRSCQLFARGELGTLRSWIEAIPPEIVRERPAIACLQAWTYVHTGRATEAEPYLDDAERGATAAGLTHLLGEVAALRAYIARLRWDLPLAIELSHEARRLAVPEDMALRKAIALNLGLALWWAWQAEPAEQAFQEAEQFALEAGQPAQAVVALCHRARMRGAQGHLQRAHELFTQAQEFAVRHGVTAAPSQSFVHLGLADLLLELDRGEEAREHLERCLQLGLADGKVDHIIMAHIISAYARLARGDPAGAAEALRRAQRGWDRHPVEHLLPAIVAAQVSTWIAVGNTSDLTAWADGTLARVEGDLTRLCETGKRTLARALLALGRPAGALDALRPVLERAETTFAGGWRSCWFETVTLLALIQQAQGNPRQAIETLERVLALAEPEGYVRTFAEYGAPLAALLGRIPSSARVSRAYIERLLAACRVTASALPEPAAPALRGPLSERELEVLRRIEDGLSNREIADALFVTVGTVKRHTNSIYTKLDVGSRTQALARARALQLLT